MFHVKHASPQRLAGRWSCGPDLDGGVLKGEHQPWRSAEAEPVARVSGARGRGEGCGPGVLGRGAAERAVARVSWGAGPRRGLWPRISIAGRVVGPIYRLP